MDAIKPKFDSKQRLGAAKRIVVKIGTNVLVRRDGNVALKVLKGLARSIARLTMSGRQVIIVSSGAVGIGAESLKLSPEMISVCAAAGQSILTALYVNAFRSQRLRTAQILLTEKEFFEAERRAQLRKTLQRLLDLSVVPVLNENDAVKQTSSIPSDHPSLSDNDMLAALVAQTIGAELLILLTDVDGVYSGAPTNANSVLIRQMVPKTELTVSSEPNGRGRGGMQAKLRAIAHAVDGNRRIAVVANGRTANIVERIVAGEPVGTMIMGEEGR